MNFVSAVFYNYILFQFKYFNLFFRYNKCVKCYNSLVSIRAFLLKRQTVQGKLGHTFRELHIMLQNLDSNWYKGTISAQNNKISRFTFDCNLFLIITITVVLISIIIVSLNFNEYILKTIEELFKRLQWIHYFMLIVNISGSFILF